MPLFPRPQADSPLILLNSASPWATTREDLEALWKCDFTSAITTRTSTLYGYPDDPTKHQVAFFGSKSSINSFGFSPYPLEQYLDWIREITKGDIERKKIIVSIGAADQEELEEMLQILSEFAAELGISLGVEFNASCPNLNGSPPPAYLPSLLESYLRSSSRSASRQLQVGIKLPPYTYEEQLVSIVKTIEKATRDRMADREVVSFLTSTNTLGQGLLFASQVTEPPRPDDKIAQRPEKSATEEFGVPNGYGGLAGEAIHQVSLGNVHRLRSLLNASKDPRMRGITLIGVGGVCDAESAQRFLRAGADAVAVATAFGREGIEVFEKIQKGMS
ncbi:uncharacterized protein JCM6883_004720 [Sporobolomyces salmoneus]|uniref:uncharacterized protein n=1 Tax=Sporobolomyces salmoneus TaxID=183962 RepID=UPI0031759B27